MSEKCLLTSKIQEKDEDYFKNWVLSWEKTKWKSASKCASA